jgi:N-carbamoyl-L-amino-acid hydrolase
MTLSKFGANAGGGVSRTGFSDADVQARAYIVDLMKKAGLQVRVDAAGNIFGRRAGSDDTLPPILFGSHIDSVPNGGNYDGDVGVLGSLECIEVLNTAGIRTKHALEVVVFVDEEHGLTGSRALIGDLGSEDLERPSNSGKTIGQGIRDIGGDPARLSEAVRKKGDYAAFIELHIEQGCTLEQEKLNIGVVEGIVGIGWWTVTVTGMANHAGTTAMNNRQDALLAASKMVVAVNEIVKSAPGRQVGTVGKIHAEPGAPNVIPGRATFSLELRDLSQEKIHTLYTQIESRLKQIASESGCAVSFRKDSENIAALTDKGLQQIIAESAKSLGLSFKVMPSGAGHDAQDMAKIAPTGMIFVPSRGGISHSPDEYTSPKDMANGVDVLVSTILMIDKE